MVQLAAMVINSFNKIDFLLTFLACSTSNCQTCDSSDNCLRCRSGYELSGNACNACGDGKYYFASSCLEGTCYSISLFKSSFSTISKGCPENCKTCSDDIHCTECNAHYIAVPSVDAISGESVNLCVECADNEYASSTTTCTSISLFYLKIHLIIIIN